MVTRFEGIACDECGRVLDVKAEERNEENLPNGYRYVHVNGFVGYFVACSGRCASAIRSRFLGGG